MSCGQKQTIAIVKTLIIQPSILLLDEATSAFDVKYEVIVQRALDIFSVGRSTITVAHRLSIIKNSDSIIVIKNDHIVEIGSYKKLLKMRGKYFYMVNICGNIYVYYSLLFNITCIHLKIIRL